MRKVKPKHRLENRIPKHHLAEKDYICNDSDRQEIHKALEKEYNTVLETSSKQTIKLTNGLLQPTSIPKYVYRFELPEEPEKQIEPDRPYEFRINHRQVKGEIHSLNEKEGFTEIYFNEDYGKHIPFIEVIFDLTILIDLVDRTIVQIDKEPTRFETTSIINLVCPELKESKESSYLNHQNRPDISLDSSQIDAIKNSLKRNLNIIWGPPGTGKTKTLQGVIAEFLAKGKKVLFASNTNNAIDGLLKDFVDSPPYEILFELKEKDKIVRVGSNSEDKVKNQFSPYKISERKSLEIKKEIDILRKERKQKEDEIKKLEQEIFCYEQWLQLQKDIQDLYADLNNLLKPDDLKQQSQLLDLYSKSLLSLIPLWDNLLSNKVLQLEQNSASLNTVLLQKKGLAIRITQTDNELKQAKQKKTEIEKEIQSLRSTDFSILNVFRKLFYANHISLLENQLLETTDKISSLEKNNQSENLQLNQTTLREAELIALISKLVEIISSNISTIDFTGCYNAVKNLNLIDLISQRTLEEFPKLKADYDFISEELIQQINFILQISSISNSDVSERLIQEKENINQQITSIDERKEEIQYGIQSKEKQLEELGNIANKPISYWERIKSDIESFQQAIIELNKKIEELENKIKMLVPQIIKEAQLLCSTLVRASYDKTTLDCRFDVLIVDEVSMVSIPQLYCAAAITKEQSLLCGDHLQLQPICQSESKSKEASKWLASSYARLIERWFESPQNRTYKLEKLKPFLSKLSLQRRMPEVISSLIKPWYEDAGNKLEDDYDEKKEKEMRELFSPLGEHFLASPDNIYILDTKELKTYYNRADKSPYNFINAVIVSEVLRELIEEKDVSPNKILCISPYRAQPQLTWSIFKKIVKKDTSIKNKKLISNVHKTQGDEAEIVIYDLTDGSQSGVLMFTKTPDLFIHNVAISRSKAKIIFVCDPEALIEKINPQKLTDQDEASLYKVLQKVKTTAKRINAKPFKEKVLKEYTLNNLLRKNSVELTSELKERIIGVPEVLFYQLLEKDVLNAQKSIFWVSPFITINRWNKLRPYFTSLVETNPNIKVEILTRPPEKMFGNIKEQNMAAVKVLNDFLELGFEVNTSEKIHGKVIVIDRGTENAISYMGSLNSLSFNNTGEINIRVEDEKMAELFINMATAGRSMPYQYQVFIESNLYRDIKETVRKELKGLKWNLAGLYHLPITLFHNDTFEYMIENPPYTDEEFKMVPNIKIPKNLIFNHIDQLREILKPLYDFKINTPMPAQKGLFNP